MNARDTVRCAIAKIGIGVPFRATDLPRMHSIHDVLGSLHDSEELAIVDREMYLRGRKRYERRVYSATTELRIVECAALPVEKWGVSGWKAVFPALFTDPNLSGTKRIVVFEEKE